MFSELVESLTRNRDPFMAQNEHAYAICCRSEAAGDVISGYNVNTYEGYALFNLEQLALAVSEKIKISHSHKP